MYNLRIYIYIQYVWKTYAAAFSTRQCSCNDKYLVLGHYGEASMTQAKCFGEFQSKKTHAQKHSETLRIIKN